MKVFRIALLLAVTGLLSSTPLYSQMIEKFFDTNKRFTEYEITGPVYPGGGFINYEANGWKLRGLSRSPAVGELLPENVIGSLITSNQLRYDLHNPAGNKYEIEGVEAYFNRKIALSELGYTLTNQEDRESEYFIIAYSSGNEIEVRMRLIAFFTNEYEFFGEIINNEEIYFIRGIYKQYTNNSNYIADSDFPSLIYIERLNQIVLGITSIQNRRALWSLDELTTDEHKVVNFAVSIFQSLRLIIRRSKVIAIKRQKYLETVQKEESSEYLIDEQFILGPSELLIERDEEATTIETAIDEQGQYQ